METIVIETMKDYLVKVKAEIEKDGLVATVDEVIERLENLTK